MGFASNTWWIAHHENPGTPGTKLKVRGNDLKMLYRPICNWLDLHLRMATIHNDWGHTAKTHIFRGFFSYLHVSFHICMFLWPIQRTCEWVLSTRSRHCGLRVVVIIEWLSSSTMTRGTPWKHTLSWVSFRHVKRDIYIHMSLLKYLECPGVDVIPSTRWLGQPGETITHTFIGCSHFYSYGVASISRLLKITGLFCRISSNI